MASRTRSEHICLAMLIIAFAVAAFWLSAGKDLWLDELFTWYQVQHKSFTGLLAATQTGFNLMPLGHFALLWGLNALHGLTPFTARAISVVSAVLGIVTFMVIWIRLWGTGPAVVLTAILVGSSETLLNMAVDVRPYALEFLVTAVALYCTLELGKNIARKDLVVLNALCSFLLPWLSYPGGLYSAMLLAGQLIICASTRRWPPIRVIISYLAGWSMFALISTGTLVAQLRHNAAGVHHAAPHFADLITTYSTLVTFPLGAVLVLLFYIAAGKAASLDAPRQSKLDAQVVPVPLPLILLLLMPLVLFAFAKLHIATVWGNRFVLPSAPAVVSAIAPFIVTWLAIHTEHKNRLHAAITIVSIGSLAVTAIALHRASRDTAVRQVAAHIFQARYREPLITAEMNTYFHLLHYPIRGLDIRLAVQDSARQELITTYSQEIKTITPEEAQTLPAFVVLEGDDRKWTEKLLRQPREHRIVIRDDSALSNPLIHCILQIDNSEKETL